MPRHNVPKYRPYEPKNLGMVVIGGHAHYLGRFDSPESWERYRRLIADLLAGGLASAANSTSPIPSPNLTLNELILAYAGFVGAYYVKDGRRTRPRLCAATVIR